MPIARLPHRIAMTPAASAGARQTVDEAVSVLHALDYRVPNRRLQNLLGIDRVEGRALQEWLEERVRLVVESADTELSVDLVSGTSASFSYPSPDTLPELDTSNARAAEGSKVIMTNLGSALYYTGKLTSKRRGSPSLLRVKVLRENRTIDVTSPRVGILEIGEGFSFDIKGVPQQNISQALARASTLFHEARHSDGNGKTLSFFHARCPSDHDYAGEYACDRATNGPYTVGAELMRTFSENCAVCSLRTRKILELRLIDLRSRILPGAREWDARPEGRVR